MHQALEAHGANWNQTYLVGQQQPMAEPVVAEIKTVHNVLTCRWIFNISSALISILLGGRGLPGPKSYFSPAE